MKQKTPIILPGFEAVSVSEDLSGQYSVSWQSGISHHPLSLVFFFFTCGSPCLVQSESSQLETRISGIPLSTGKKDPLFGNTGAELKDKGTPKSTKNVSVSLRFCFCSRWNFPDTDDSGSSCFGQQGVQDGALM